MENLIKIDVKGIPVFIYTERPEYKNAFAIYKDHKIDFGFNKGLMVIMNPVELEDYLLDVIHKAYAKRTRQNKWNK